MDQEARCQKNHFKYAIYNTLIYLEHMYRMYNESQY